MPECSAKDKRQFEHVKESVLEGGKPEQTADEIEARTVNKQRREEGRTPNSTTQGTGNPNTNLESRTVDELQNRAAELHIEGRSKMNKDELVEAIREANGEHSISLGVVDRARVLSAARNESLSASLGGHSLFGQ